MGWSQEVASMAFFTWHKTPWASLLLLLNKINILKKI
jgi:hypothetical protein